MFWKDFNRKGERQSKARARPITLDWPIFFVSEQIKIPPKSLFHPKSIFFQRRFIMDRWVRGVRGHIPHILSLRRGRNSRCTKVLLYLTVMATPFSTTSGPFHKKMSRTPWSPWGWLDPPTCFSHVLTAE